MVKIYIIDYYGFKLKLSDSRGEPDEYSQNNAKLMIDRTEKNEAEYLIQTR